MSADKSNINSPSSVYSTLRFMRALSGDKMESGNKLARPGFVTDTWKSGDDETYATGCEGGERIKNEPAVGSS